MQGVSPFRSAQLAYGLGVPSFVNYDLLLLLYIDDYIGLRLYEDGVEQVQLDKEVVKRVLTQKGLEVHKEEFGPQVRSLGHDLGGYPPTVVSGAEKQWQRRPGRGSVVET